MADTVTDAAMTKLAGLGFTTGSLADREFAWLQANTPTDGSRADMARQVPLAPKVPLPIP